MAEIWKNDFSFGEDLSKENSTEQGANVSNPLEYNSFK